MTYPALNERHPKPFAPTTTNEVALSAGAAKMVAGLPAATFLSQRARAHLRKKLREISSR